MTEINWRELAAALKAPFKEQEVSWVVVASKNKGRPEQMDLYAPYIDADAIRDRLDEVCGPGGWAMDMEAANATSIICRLTVLGVTRADVGDGKDADQPLKAAATDALKRAAQNFGIGRYLHKVAKQWRKPEAGAPKGNPRGGQRQPPRPQPEKADNGPSPARQLTSGQKAFEDIMKGHELTLGRACDLLDANIGATPQEALWNHIRDLMARKGCDEDAAYKAAADELSAAVSADTLSS